MAANMIMAEATTSLGKLVKDNKYEIVQIESVSTNSIPMNDAILYYLQQAAICYELMSGTEHPLVAEIYSKISLRYGELAKPLISLNWMRKSFCIFYTTLGMYDEVVKRCYEYVRRKEANFSTQFADMGMEQLCNALVERFAEGEFGGWDGDDEDNDDDYPQLTLESSRERISAVGGA
jgi:hypothetical protein